MVTKTVYVCESCNYESDQQDPNMTKEQEIKQCMICNLDYCGACGEEHAKEETGLTW